MRAGMLSLASLNLKVQKHLLVSFSLDFSFVVRMALRDLKSLASSAPSRSVCFWGV